MDAMLHALGGILLGAVPTFLLVILLHFYLKSIFFKPLEKVLRQRYEATEGARKLAEQSLQQAAAKTASYEAQLRAAKAEMYQAQDQLHKQLQEREAAAVRRPMCHAFGQGDERTLSVVKDMARKSPVTIKITISRGVRIA